MSISQVEVVPSWAVRVTAPKVMIGIDALPVPR
jgi:hypothetical protein